MTQLLEPPSRRPRRRLPVPRLSSNPETRSIQIGILGTILVHLLLFLLVPRMLQEPKLTLAMRPKAPQQFNIELAPEEPPPPPKTPPPNKFVEVNPDAPDNPPDKTQNFGAQNQQLAQEKPSEKTNGDKPAIEGQTEIKTDQIVTGELKPVTPPRPNTPPPEEQTPPEKAPSPARREQNPLGGYEKQVGETEDNFGSNIAKVPEHADKVDKSVTGEKDAPLAPDAVSTFRIDPKHPQPRPLLDRNQKRARPAIFTENKIGTENIGPVAYDARWSNYGQYLQQLIETVQIQWERILTQSSVSPMRGTQVTVKFTLNRKGEVSRIIHVEGTAGDQGRRACVSAITARSPYGEWTDDMVAMLGEQQDLTFSFYYQ